MNDRSLSTRVTRVYCVRFYAFTGYCKRVPCVGSIVKACLHEPLESPFKNEFYAVLCYCSDIALKRLKVMLTNGDMV